jgi:hypothetical protein
MEQEKKKGRKNRKKDESLDGGVQALSVECGKSFMPNNTVHTCLAQR